MISKSDYEYEAKRVKRAVELLKEAQKQNVENMNRATSGISEMQSYISSHFASMDPEERATMKLVLEEGDFQIVELITRDVVLKKQVESPYFGRVDFQAFDETSSSPYYIGISNLQDKDGKTPFICDWRAPISSLYYDFEVGRAQYPAPIGKIPGDISLKRQYKIAQQELQYCFDSNLTIGDDILQATLSQTTDSKMKNIVSTIQKEQNQIIRSDLYKTLLVQGVAGSGKTSIALHRVAFLLYKHKDKIKSKDIMIISPNKIFSDYISNVLPELGEQNIMEITFGEIARDELNEIIKSEEREDMLESVVQGDSVRAKEVEYKSSFEFYNKLKDYLKTIVDVSFEAQDIVVGEIIIPKEAIQELYTTRYAGKDISTKIEYIADFATDEIIFQNEGKGGVFNRVKAKLYKMFKKVDVLSIYDEFLKTLGKSLILTENGALRYEDIAPVILIKDYMIGVEKDKSVKYLLIDEMQDYSPIHFYLFNKKYACPKTVLGDIHQCFEKKLDDQYLKELVKLFSDGMLLNMKKSYRSTVEIASFAQRIIKLTDVDNVDRHGEEPEIIMAQSKQDEIERIILELKEFKNKNYARVAVICKTDEEAKFVSEQLEGKIDNFLLTKDVTQIDGGNIITSSAMSKGLEYDAVIIPFVNEDNYRTTVDANLLYVACTRALHELKIIYDNKLTSFISRENNYAVR